MTVYVNTAAELIVACLEAEGIDYMFSIPGEENIRLVEETAGSSIRFILARHEQAAVFMAELYGRLTGRAAVCTATLGPGAINLLLGVADAQTDNPPLVGPVGHAENMQLTDRLGQLTMALGRMTGADAATTSSIWLRSIGASSLLLTTVDSRC